MAEIVVELTPLTVGQFKVGGEYGTGKIVSVGPAEMLVSYPNEPQNTVPIVISGPQVENLVIKTTN